MIAVFNYREQKPVYELFIGDYFATTEKDVYLSTVLGPCIAVCLADKLTGVVGMNHFMLPDGSRKGDNRYGLNAMNALLEAMVKQGASLAGIKAKVFGGANFLRDGSKKLAYGNIVFIESFLQTLKVPVEAQDTGDCCGRRVYFCSTTYAVYLRRFGKPGDNGQSIEHLAFY